MRNRTCRSLYLAGPAACALVWAIASAGEAPRGSGAQNDQMTAVLWMQRSAEYKASCIQVFGQARRQLGPALADKKWTACIEQVGQKGMEELPVAIIADVDAIHPGYGFLSENAHFAEIVAEHGVTFIGPAPEHIRLMGDKVAARATFAGLGLAMVPGSDGPIGDTEAALAIAAEIGYPVLVKASAGGGGRGSGPGSEWAAAPGRRGLGR